MPFVILDAQRRIGDVWRRRWDSLRLFTPASSTASTACRSRRRDYFPTKDEMADYLEAYARHFALPVRRACASIASRGRATRFLVVAGDQRFEADNVVVAMANYQKPRVPAFAAELDPRSCSSTRSTTAIPSQLRTGGVLIVGAGNSARRSRSRLCVGTTTWMAGRDTGQVPFRIDGLAARLLLMRWCCAWCSTAS